MRLFIYLEFVGEEGINLGCGCISEEIHCLEKPQRIVKQGSASPLQRKLKLGYRSFNRPLESAGIVGPFEGSKSKYPLIF
jgi:hypothetical protein